MPNDAYHGDDPVGLVRAMALPLASAQNYLAGVQVRARSLAELPLGSEAARGQILDGIAGAIRHLQGVASMMEDNQREVSHVACSSLAEFETSEDLLASWLAARARE